MINVAKLIEWYNDRLPHIEDPFRGYNDIEKLDEAFTRTLNTHTLEEISIGKLSCNYVNVEGEENYKADFRIKLDGSGEWWEMLHEDILFSNNKPKINCSWGKYLEFSIPLTNKEEVQEHLKSFMFNIKNWIEMFNRNVRHFNQNIRNILVHKLEAKKAKLKSFDEMVMLNEIIEDIVNEYYAEGYVA